MAVGAAAAANLWELLKHCCRHVHSFCCCFLLVVLFPSVAYQEEHYMYFIHQLALSIDNQTMKRDEKETMRNCVVFFCGCGVRCGFFLSLSFNWIRWIDPKLTKHTHTHNASPPPLCVWKRVWKRLLIIPTASSLPTTTIFVLLYMYFPVLRFSDYFFKFIRVCCCRLSSFSLLMFLLPLFVFSFPGSFFGQLIASSIVVFHAYASIFSLIICLVFFAVFLHVCFRGISCICFVISGPELGNEICFFAYLLSAIHSWRFQATFQLASMWISFMVGLVDTCAAVRYTNLNCLV